MLCVISYFYWQTLAMMSFVQNEWNQHTVKEKYFPDSEFSKNISSCNNPNRSSVELPDVHQGPARFCSVEYLHQYRSPRGRFYYQPDPTLLYRHVRQEVSLHLDCIRILGQNLDGLHSHLHRTKYRLRSGC